MIEKHRNELEKLPDEIKYEINKCMAIHRELERYDKGDLDLNTLQKKLEIILEEYEL